MGRHNRPPAYRHTGGDRTDRIFKTGCIRVGLTKTRWKRASIAVFAIALVLAAVLGHWRGRSLIFSAIFDLPIANYGVEIDTDIAVEMHDGIVLYADIYRPRGAEQPPTVLMRTPYGKAAASTRPFAMALARRGYLVVAQDVRGTGASEGVFTPLLHERRDGGDTVEWLRRQLWFDGRLGLFGLSYIGFTANAIAVDNPAEVKAVFAPVTTRGFYEVYYETGGFNLDAALSWAVIMQRQKANTHTGISIWQKLLARGREQAPIPFDALPVAAADVAATGETVDFYRIFATRTDPGSDYWRLSSLSENDIAGITAPVYLASAWYDTLLPRVLADYSALKSAGREPRLVIGDGPHIDTPALLRYLKHSIAWFDHYLKGRPLSLTDAPVRIRRMGDSAWLEFDDWPPDSPRRSFYLSAEGGLHRQIASTGAGPTHYVFDPANPTPALGGPLLAATDPVIDNAQLEARPDTVVFTTEALAHDIDIIGEPSAQIYIEADRPTFDLFVRLAYVDEKGVSKNITDGIRRFYRQGAAGHPLAASLNLWPTAIRVRAGQRLRVTVASGAHPRIARNLGRGNPAEQAHMTTMDATSIKIYHDAEHPSHINLPLRTPSPAD